MADLLAQQAEAFCEASIRDWTGRAARMLEATPVVCMRPSRQHTS